MTVPTPSATARLAPAKPPAGLRRRRRAWTLAFSVVLHLLILAVLLTLARRPQGEEGSQAPSYQLMFENPNPTVPPGRPDAGPVVAPEQPPTPPAPPPPSPAPPPVDALPGPESPPPVAAPVPEAPPTPAPPAAAPPAVEPPAPPVPPTVEPVPPPVPAPAPPVVQPPVVQPPVVQPPVDAPAAPEPTLSLQPATPPQVRLQTPDAPPAPARPAPDFVVPTPPQPLAPPTPPRPPPPPRPRTAPPQTQAGTFANPMDLNFGPSAARPPAARLNAPRGSVASRSLDLSPGAPKGPNRAEAFFDARAARLGVDWQGALMTYWLTHRYYPRQAADDGEDGSVDLELTVGASGKVENAVLKSKSGNQFIDMAALGTWRNAKLPPLPPELGERYTFTITINYILIR